MLSIKRNFPLLFSLLCFAFLLPFITSFPVTSGDDPFAKFVLFLTQNNCSLPKEVDIPFPDTESSPFSYLSTPLKECQSPKALKVNNEAHLLCKEVFDVFQNITCNDYSLLPKINNSRLSENICKDFAAIQDSLPKQNEYLSRKLGDDVICKVLCTENYELLCKTLLWSYETQANIKKALDSRIKENEKEIINNVPTRNDPNEKITTGQGEQGPGNQKEANEIVDKIPVPDLEDSKNLSSVSSLINLELKPSSSESPINDGTPRNISPLNSSKDNKLINSNNTSQIIPIIVSSKVDTQADVQKGFSKSILNDNVQPSEQSSEVLDKNIPQEENGIEKQSENNKVENSVKDVSRSKDNNLTTENINNQNRVSSTLLSVPVKGNNENNTKSSTNIKPNEKTASPIVPETEVDSGMTNVGLQEPSENETKDEKLTDLKKKQNSKENFISDGVTLEMDSNLLPSTALSVYSDKNEDLEQHSEVKDPELYNDSENDGDYPKQEYDTAFSSSLKKDSDIKNSVQDGASHISSSSSIQISPENFPGRFDGSQSYLPARNYLPEQEDSHFFFYFLSIVLILMAGYLIFHNKQKIIALIVEGRHERRRRSHGAGYKKLETK